MTTPASNVLFRRILTSLVCMGVFVLGYLSSQNKIFRSVELNLHKGPVHLPKPFEEAIIDNRCPNVLELMTQGHWKTRRLTQEEHKMAEWFYRMALNHKGVPASLQRPDGRCGNIGYTNVTAFLRAVCSPTGPTPCCYNFKCVNKNVKQCQCRNCWDIRQQIHAEYSTWIPSDVRCKPRQYSSKQSCELLDGGSIYFLGDSLIRHIYTGFLMTLRGNFKDGGLTKKEQAIWKVKCAGMRMFEEKNCRRRLDANPRDVCQGKVTLSWKKHYGARRWKELIDDVTNKLADRRTLFVVGIGIHEDYNSTKVKFQYLKPTLDRLQKIGILWPKFLFVDMNAPGIMKRSDTQSKPFVLKFNIDMEKFLTSYNIPVLKTFNMTDGVRSFDGTHYSLGVNELKARILLNYIQELRNTGVW